MLDLGSRARESRVARATLLALGAAFLITLPVRAAQAQSTPIDPCVADPASCLPPLDPCVADPASCLPPLDPCVADPASCLPPLEDPCVADPASCLPTPPQLEKCADSPADCLPKTSGGDDDSDETIAVPGEGDGSPPRSTGGGDATGPSSDALPASSPSTSSQQTGEAVSLSPVADRTDGFLDGIGRGLIDAARRFAFPLMLAASVAAFLLVQGRIDRGDPKLAVAPIDARDDLVLFR